MFIGTGLKCKECKYKCHKECESKVPSSCGIPQQFVEEFHKTLPECKFSFRKSNKLRLFGGGGGRLKYFKI